jgi:hypothetical protein
MKNVILALALVALFAAPVLAANGNVSSDMLSKMGLSSMQVMSDEQGTSVRGMGYVIAAGVSYAQAGCKVEAFDAQIAIGKHCAFVVNGAIAKSKCNFAAAGGFAIAK